MSIGQIIGIVAFVIIAGIAFRYRDEIKNFFLEAVSELKKVSWSTKHELMEATWIVIISSAVLGLFIGITDFVLSKLVGLLIQ